MGLKYLHLTHHKCGTHWVNSVCHEMCLILGKSWQSASNASFFGNDMDLYAEKNGVDFLSYTNAKYGMLSRKENRLGFHVIRDPRDILVSSYFSSLKTHSESNWPELTAHRKKLENLSREEGILLEMEFISDVFESLAEWNYEDSRILEVKMENLMENNYAIFLQIFLHLGLIDENDRSTSSVRIQILNVMRNVINRLHIRSRGVSLIHFYPEYVPVLNFLGVVHRNRFEGKSGGRMPGEECLDSHYRKGVSADWINHFTPRIKEEFYERYGQLLVDLGYLSGCEQVDA